MSVHYITVTAQFDGEVELEPLVQFECRGDLSAECHRYPDCGCESWTLTDGFDEEGHGVIGHSTCWAADWFENGAHHYAGQDADDAGDYNIPAGFNRSGAVALDFAGDYIEWTYEATP